MHSSQNLYNLHIHYGWPEDFDKEQCKPNLIELVAQKDREDEERMDAANPDSEMFDSD